MFFHLAVQFSKYRSGFFRSLKTIQVQEEEQSFDQALLGFSFCLALSSSSQLSLRSTWNESPSFLFDSLPRKEVIQPHLPIRLPCYDFTPIADPTFDIFSHGFGYYQLSWCDGRCVQGPGTYSPRHADPRLLATPTSCGRVAAHNLN